ncbi:hypothetical protein BGX28_008296 [Mortierella sp. GBA30]|nr:hypothetical protein BGX28_008296 [Mortierella sp. GBA30]
MIQRAQLCLALEGGMWMLASLNKLERLAIGTETWTKSELMDWDWMARYPDATYGDECAEKTECWPRLEFLGLDFVDVVHRKPYPLEKRFAKVIAQIRPGVELSFDSGTW